MDLIDVEMEVDNVANVVVKIESGKRNGNYQIFEIEREISLSTLDFSLESETLVNACYNFPFKVLPFNQPQNIPIGSTLIGYGTMKLKIERMCISFKDATFQKKY